MLSKCFSILKNRKKQELYDKRLDDFIYSQKIQNPQKKYFSNQHFDVVVSYTVHLCTGDGVIN